MGEVTVQKVAVMGLRERYQSSRYQKWGYGKGNSLADGSYWVMAELKVEKMAVMRLWEK